MAEDIGTLQVRIEADVKALKNSMKSAGDEISNFSSNSKKSLLSFQNIAETALGFTFANFATRAIDSIISFTKFHANIITMEFLFNTIFSVFIILISVPGMYLLHFKILSSNEFLIIILLSLEIIKSSEAFVGDP